MYLNEDVDVSFVQVADEIELVAVDPAAPGWSRRGFGISDAVDLAFTYGVRPEAGGFLRIWKRIGTSGKLVLDVVQ